MEVLSNSQSEEKGGGGGNNLNENLEFKLN